MRVFTILSGTLFFLHINACSFSLVASATSGESRHNSWVYQVGGLGALDWQTEYLNAMYWAATTSTTVGYGDVIPQNNGEKAFCIISMCIGVGVYGYVIGMMTSIATSVSHVNKMVLKEMDQVNALVRIHNLPRELQLCLMSFFRNHYTESGPLKQGMQRKIFETMPYPLLLRCRNYIMAAHLFQLAFFKALLPKFFPAMIELLVPDTGNGRIIIAGQQPHPYFFILLSGRVKIQQPRGKPEDFDIAARDSSGNVDSQKIKECNNALKLMFEHNFKDGSMDATELHQMLNKLAGRTDDGGLNHIDHDERVFQCITEEQSDTIFRQIDSDKSGTVELSEFASWYMTEKLKLATGSVCRYGNTRRVLGPVSMFGTWSAFDFGRSKYNYVCPNPCQMYKVDADKFQATFKYTQIHARLERHFVDPLEKYGADIDIVGDNSSKAPSPDAACGQDVDNSKPSKPRTQSSVMLRHIWNGRGNKYVSMESEHGLEYIPPPEEDRSFQASNRVRATSRMRISPAAGVKATEGQPGPYLLELSEVKQQIKRSEERLVTRIKLMESKLDTLLDNIDKL